MIPVIIDTDPGVDDALALIYALASNAFSLKGLTTVFGNVPVATATRNALWLLKSLGQANVSVAQGASCPLSGLEPIYAAEVHGSGGFGTFAVPEVSRKPNALDAADFLIAASHDHPHDLVIVALGPLTNLAEAAKRDPSLPDRIGRVVIMGGAFEVPGNVTSTAEANIFNDPEAAAIVASEFRVVDFVGLDVTDRVLLTEEDCNSLASSTSELGAFLTEMTSFYLDFYENRTGKRCASLHDPATLICLARPELFEFVSGQIMVCETGQHKGQTRCNAQHSTVRYAQSAEFKEVRADFIKTLGQYFSDK